MVMRSSKHHQSGVTGLGWLIILSIIAFFVFLVLKLMPIFLENFNVKSSLKSMEKESGLYRKDKVQIRNNIIAKLNVNDVKNVQKKNIKVNKRSGSVIINIAYTVKTPLMGPLSLVAEFNEDAEVTN